MYTATLIRRHINRLTEDKPFSIREFLNYGSRNAVDQVFYRLVQSGQIIRIAQGLFIKHTSPIPSILDVALAKAIDFGKSLRIHGAQAAQQLKLRTNISTEGESIYACDGSSSSFRFGNVRIRFINASQRKLGLGDELPGLAIRALWYLGKSNCSSQLAGDAIALFNRYDRQALREKIKIMPAWLANYFIGSNGNSTQRQMLDSAQKQMLKNSFQSYFY